MLLVTTSAQAVGWRLGTAIGAPGDMVSLDVGFETDSSTRAGEIEFALTSQHFEILQITPVSGTCTRTTPQWTHASIDIPAPAALGRYVVCRLTVRILPTAWPQLSPTHLGEWMCRNEQGPWTCPGRAGAIKVTGGPVYPELRTKPSPPIAGVPFVARIDLYCEYVFSSTGAPYDIEVHPGLIRVNVDILPGAFSPCGDPAEGPFEFAMPALPVGVHRIELLANSLYSPSPYRYILDVIDVTVVDPRAVPRPVPVASAWMLALLAVFSGYAGWRRLNAPAPAPRTC